MNRSPQSQNRTRLFSRVIGPYFVIVCVLAVARASDMQELLADFEANSLWTWVAGAIALLLGLIVVGIHQYWHSPAAVIVSIFGWLMVARGLLLLAFPGTFVSVANNMIGAQLVWVAMCVVFALVGLYLTYVGWAPAPSQHSAHSADTARDLSNAA
ncbi:MAG: hypothetical protein AB7G47_02010 [Mycolicibacterium sp.]|uniref:hypothetical protein n=1 Tax=Mycolicibacterium sp. TaxID=2320850 RepID=UPI003D0B54DC